jgi:hypothetical protein
MNRTARTFLIALGVSIVYGQLVQSANGQGSDPYLGVPLGFDFPADNATLEKYRATQNVAEMRKHAWMVWAGINQAAPSGGPLWETWFSADDAFRLGPPPAAARTLSRRFVPPRQFQGEGAQPQAAGQSLLSFVLFNKETYGHIRGNQLYSQTKLAGLNDAFPAGTAISARKLPDFPRESMSLKLVWWPVKQQGLTAMPVWDFTPSQTGLQGNPPPTWSRTVAVDPSRTTIPADETQQLDVRIVRNGMSVLENRKCHVVPLQKFYFVKLSTPQEASSASAATGQDLAVGDFAVLVCVHMTTKEIDDWVWATFWWHDRPNDGPYAADRTDKVPEFARNYLMNVAYDTNTPREHDGTPHACFNPWLEARFTGTSSVPAGGMASNCMTCHQRATFPIRPFLPITRGGLQPEDPYFKDVMKLDFLWSVGLESQPNTP